MTMRRVKVSVLPDGSVEADFSGFAGSDCVEEAERLAANLARFGLKVETRGLVRKSSAETEETQSEEEQGAQPRAGDGVPTGR